MLALPDRIDMLRSALAELQAHHFAASASHCLMLLQQDPDDIEALLVRGLAIGADGDAEQAALLLDRVARARRDVAHPCRDLATLLRQSGHPERIEPLFDAALRHAPDDVSLRFAYADFLYDTGRAEAAATQLTALLRLQPDFPLAHNLLALALADLGRTGEALDSLREALRIAPDYAAAWTNLGLLLKTCDRFEEAIAAYDMALALRSDDPQIRVNRVVTLLRAGRWTEAWSDYEWRLRLPGSPALTAPLLPDQADLPNLGGRTVLVVHENGFGDTLQFARYLPLLAARGAKVIVAVPPPLTRIISIVPGIDAVIEMADPVPPHDFICPFCSLPRAFGSTPDTVPDAPYLRVDAALVAYWGQRLPAAPLRVGLCWAGQARDWLPGFGTLDARRSLPLAALALLADVAGVTFISLQKGAAASQAATSGIALCPVIDQTKDFADTAAIVTNLDLVISVDTAMVHLAGGLGKPVFMLDRYDNCWRWLSGRRDSPWYPSMRIFRQDRVGDWQPVLRDVAAALAAFSD